MSMVASLDSAFFPHIFSEVIAQSDFKTQNKLRLLSSSVKHEVDRLQCVEITLAVNWIGDNDAPIL